MNASLRTVAAAVALCAIAAGAVAALGLAEAAAAVQAEPMLDVPRTPVELECVPRPPADVQATA